MDPLTCPFCNPSPEDIVLENDLCYARYDQYPASPGHLLLIPFRHVAGLFDATEAEQTALLALVREAKTLLDEQFHPDGYNIGANVGEAAGPFSGGVVAGEDDWKRDSLRQVSLTHLSTQESHPFSAAPGGQVLCQHQQT